MSAADGNGNGNRAWSRRTFLVTSGAAIAGLALWKFQSFATFPVEAASDQPPKIVTIVEFTDSAEQKDIITVPMIRKSDVEWRRELSNASFEITRNAGTERPFTGTLLNVHDKGVFRCICCDTALFNSNTKFESGTGWPSFWAPIAKQNVVETRDLSAGMSRVAVSCARCAAHAGHVFDDGPRPTGLRYCMNSVALRFAKAS
jgi:peptide-methionine (R)-S-oxide reductase